MLVSTKISLPNNSALAEGTRVKLTGGFLVAASSSEDELGTIEQRVLATDTTATVLPINHAGVRHMIAAGAISQYATVYAAASGKIDASGTLLRGVALEAASGSGSVIKVLFANGASLGSQTLFVASATVAVGGTAIGNANAVGYGFTKVTGADNTAAVSLPAAVAGGIAILKTTTSGKVLCVFPAVNNSINGAANNAVYNMANLSQRVFVAYDSTTWYTAPETPT
jgi:hypothetical protein